MSFEMLNAGTAVFSFTSCASSAHPMLLRVSSLACGAVRMTRTMRDTFLPDRSDVVVDRDMAECTVTDTGTEYHVHCRNNMLQISKMTGSVTYMTADGKLLLHEDRHHPCVMEEKPVYINHFDQNAQVTCRQTLDGLRASSDGFDSVVDRIAYACRLSFEFEEKEGLYGLGSHEEGYGNLRGKCRDLYQHNMKAVVPVLVSTKGWGILFDIGCLMSFHDDADGSYLWADCADEMDFYFLGSGYQEVCRQYAELTGHAPLLPRYAFGFIQSKERYKDADELIQVVKEYRRREVPLDLIVQDWQSWPDGQWGYKVFDPNRFPDPRALTESLHALGAKIMISIWPSMQGEQNQDRIEMLHHGYMLGNRTIYNAFNEKARALYWKQAKEGLFQYGIDAWWCDCTEPFEADWHGLLKPEPFERVQMNTAEAKKYLNPGKICLYSLYHSMGIYQGQRNTTLSKRVLNLTRSSWAGQHRYGTVTWSGDVSATWETLRRQVPEGLNFMATGEAWWTTDAGGFFPSACNGAWFAAGEFEKGVKDPGYCELFVRWMQYAVFLPMMRAHGTGTPREIWQFGEKGSLWYDALEKAIRLRSTLVPYLYSLSYQYVSSGLPPVRVPALMFPDDVHSRCVDDEMMLGNLLVKPVVHPMMYLPGGRPISRFDDTETVYLPSGSAWYAWNTDQRYAGGQILSVHAPIDRIPVFVRAGSILITGPMLQYADALENPPLNVCIYPGADAVFTWYLDAGEGYGYEKGEFATVIFRWNDTSSLFTISARSGHWPGMSSSIDLHISLSTGPETFLQYTGNEVAVRFAAESKE